MPLFVPKTESETPIADAKEAKKKANRAAEIAAANAESARIKAANEAQRKLQVAKDAIAIEKPLSLIGRLAALAKRKKDAQEEGGSG